MARKAKAKPKAVAAQVGASRGGAKGGLPDHLENQWARAIVVMLKTPILEEAAAELGVHEDTLRRWRKDPAFLSRLADARDEMLGHAMVTLGADYGKSLLALRDIRDHNRNPIARYMAAAKLMDSATAQFETEGLLQRFARIVDRCRKMEARLVELGDEAWLRSLDA